MVYFLGRDVKIYIGTESDTADKNVAVLSGAVAGTTDVQVIATGTTNADYFAYSLAEGATVADWPANVADVTGIDISTGKVEIKNEYTISITRKKATNTWDTIFNGPVLTTSAENGAGKHGARWGLAGDYGNSTEAAPKVASGLENPKDYATATKVEAGYRILIVLKGTAAGETMAFPNCLITAHTVSINADGTTEETMELVTQQKALQGASGLAFNVTQTATGDY